MVYSNGNIDILYDDETIYNFTDLKNNNIGSLNINEVKIIGDYAYISTSIGLVIFDVKRREIKNTYRFIDASSKKLVSVNTSVILGDSLLCGTSVGIYLGHLSDNLLDQSKWKMFLARNFIDLFEFDGILWGRLYNNSLRTIQRTNASLYTIKQNVDGISFLSDGRLALIQDTLVTLYTTSSDYKEINFKKHVYHFMADGNKIWISQGIDGLCLYNLHDDDVICKSEGIKPNSPRRNLFHSVSWPEPGKLLIVGGYHNYLGVDYPGTVMIYENERWTSLDEDITSKTGLKYVNLTEAVQDPKDHNHILRIVKLAHLR